MNPINLVYWGSRLELDRFRTRAHPLWLSCRISASGSRNRRAHLCLLRIFWNMLKVLVCWSANKLSGHRYVWRCREEIQYIKWQQDDVMNKTVELMRINLISCSRGIGTVHYLYRCSLACGDCLCSNCGDMCDCVCLVRASGLMR